ncbi:pickpocket protein 28-like [Photinus pyralis]|uniref:pickpocket protein 28-like n=1 Tax=Photinus pyralis TaxID=7054 RepID=UPI001267010F|nr:pickpocket protein 28-like [Photinus pyralis]
MKLKKKTPQLTKTKLIRVGAWNDDKCTKRSFFFHLKCYLAQYCHATTIHGLKYVGERGRHFIERVVWVGIVIFFCVCCVSLTNRTFSKWMSSPVMVTFETQETTIHEIPFPAVTICPEAKFDPQKFNITEMFLRRGRNGTFSKLEEEYLQAAYLICDTEFDISNWNQTLTPYSSYKLYDVALHHPCEFPNMDKHFQLPLDQAVLVAIKPSRITISADLWGYSPNERKCYLAGERNLTSFRLYTQQNCLTECLANYTFNKCRCIPFHYPLLFSDSTLCGPRNKYCVKQSKIDYFKIEAGMESSQQCDCLPLCASLSYDVETSHTDWNWKIAMSITPSQESADLAQNAHFSKLNVFYKDLQFLSCKRNAGFGVVDLLSNMGGFLGLFIGFSVTSAIEILYFCSLRIICNIKRHGKRAWSGEL